MNGLESRLKAIESQPEGEVEPKLEARRTERRREALRHDHQVAVGIRPLTPSEWQQFRDFRLAALQADPGVFASSYETAVEYSQARWEQTISGPTHQTFGLFDDDVLIGITAVFTSREDPSGETAVLAMSFIEPEYRGKALSRMLYDARFEWIQQHPQFKKVGGSHRASNEASRRASHRCGFVMTGREPRTWPDGTIEDEVFYERRL